MVVVVRDLSTVLTCGIQPAVKRRLDHLCSGHEATSFHVDYWTLKDAVEPETTSPARSVNHLQLTGVLQLSAGDFLTCEA